MNDDEYGDVPGHRDVATVLASDPIYRIAGDRLRNPIVFGVVLFVLVMAMIVFGPSSESRFIYTDF